LPGGNRNSNGSFNNVGSNGNWWTATEGGSGAYNRNMNSGNDNVNENTNDKSNGFSVRCLQDCAGEAEILPPLFLPCH